jgi:ABC-type polysaccharide/polyol phosphate export permease
MRVVGKLGLMVRVSRDGILQPLVALWRHRLLVGLLIRREVVGRTSGTLFRAGWLLIGPGLQVLAFWFLLDVVLRIRLPGHVVFLDYFLVGILAWFLMVEVLQRALGIFAEQAALYQRGDFPLVLLPLLPLVMGLLVHGTVYLSSVRCCSASARCRSPPACWPCCSCCWCRPPTCLPCSAISCAICASCCRSC